MLTVMAYDRYVAICKPLHYTFIMNRRICVLLVATVWLSGMTYAVSEATLTLQLPLCGRNTLDHLLCEIPVLIKTACGAKVANELTLSVVCIFFLAVPLCLILIFYACIGHAVFKIKSLGGRKKAFGTMMRGRVPSTGSNFRETVTSWAGVQPGEVLILEN